METISIEQIEVKKYVGGLIERRTGERGRVSGRRKDYPIRVGWCHAMARGVKNLNTPTDKQGVHLIGIAIVVLLILDFENTLSVREGGRRFFD